MEKKEIVRRIRVIGVSDDGFSFLNMVEFCMRRLKVHFIDDGICFSIDDSNHFTLFKREKNFTYRIVCGDVKIVGVADNQMAAQVFYDEIQKEYRL